MPESITCEKCETEIPLRDIVMRYMRMREVAPDVKVGAVACPGCAHAIPLTPEEFDAVREAAERATEAIEISAVETSARSRHGALLLLLAHELGLTPGSCAEEDIVVRVRDLVADAKAAKALVDEIRKRRATANGYALMLAKDPATEAATRGLHGQGGSSPVVAEHRAVAVAMQALLMFDKQTRATIANEGVEIDDQSEALS